MMKFLYPIVTLLVIQSGFAEEVSHADGKRIARQASSNADQMVQNILQWLQGVYMQNTRRIRQGTVREYLPPSNTQRPRPFQTTTTLEPIDANEVNNGGYGPSGITPQPPFPSPSPGGYPSPPPDINPPFTGGYPTQRPSGFETTQKPGFSTGYPGYETTQKPGFSTGYPGYESTVKPGFSTGYPGYDTTQRPGYETTQKPGFSTGYPGYDTTQRGSEFTTNGYQPQGPNGGYQTTQRPPFTSGTEPQEQPSTPDDNSVIPTGSPTDEDLLHPPHIHDIDVQCAKDMMTINIEFNRVFNGIIYSKGHYSNSECRYVTENSNQIKYSITVSLNSCGTEFVNGFETEGQSYLENVLVLQNEPGIQEVWDTVRAVRCLWEGNLNQALSVALSVGMLTQEIVTFSGDTAMARLDIQLGRGPFAPPANGLVKIGELMTLVVSVTGDPAFDIQVRDCKAKDSTGENEVALTDENGCVLKPKLFGAFQKTKDTQNTGASVIAYAFFNAFKFPDVMDLMIECNIELCKVNCEMCPDTNQKLEPGRRRRSVGNESLADEVTMGKMLHVILPEDLNEGTAIVNLVTDSLCMSTQSFVFSAFCLVSLLLAASMCSAILWLKNQQLRVKS